MTRCLLGLGSNLGDRGATLRRATSEVARLPRCQLLARSRWYETAPVGGPAGQNAFLNAALLLEASVEPQELMLALQAIESQLGRDRGIRWDARPIDIDLLLYGRRVIVSPELLVPHPRMSFRRFVLEPAAEIAGSMVHPRSGWTIAGLLSYLSSSPHYVAVCAAETAISAWLAERLTRALGGLRLEDACQIAKNVGDSTAGMAIEFSQWASIALRRTRWEQDLQLSKRLSSGNKGPSASVPPVVSGFWYRTQRLQAATPPLAGVPATEGNGNVAKPDRLPEGDIVRPALVITCEPASPQNFLEKILDKKLQANSIIPDVPHAKFRELLEQAGHGPMARIEADDPAVALHEAVAAVRCVWPELPITSAE